MTSPTLALIGQLTAGGAGVPLEDAKEMVLRAFEERAKELQDRFANDPSRRANDPWIDGWLTAAEYFIPRDENLYGPGGVPI